MNNIFIVLILGLTMTSCKPKQVANETHSSTEKETTLKPQQSLQPITISEMVDMKNIGDPYTIENAVISGDTLILQLSFGGGCEDHDFELLNNNAFKENIDDFGKVMDYQTRITLKHNANNDRCRSIVREKKRFDLTPIRQNGSMRIRMQLSGWENELIYQYTPTNH